MKHDSTHKLDLACLDCIRVHLEQKEKLLSFVRELADESCYEKYENENEINWAAHELLESIEADNE